MKKTLAMFVVALCLALLPVRAYADASNSESPSEETLPLAEQSSPASDLADPLPLVPAEPDKPVVPDTPVIPGIPDELDVSEVTDMSDVTDMPGNPTGPKKAKPSVELREPVPAPERPLLGEPGQTAGPEQMQADRPSKMKARAIGQSTEKNQSLPQAGADDPPETAVGESHDAITSEEKPSVALTSTPSFFDQLRDSVKSWFVSAAGDDDAGDGSETSPYATINKAYDQTSPGDIIVLLSDIVQNRCVDIWHDLTIDGRGHTVTRQSGFETKSDDARSWYNPAMFEVHPDNCGTTATFRNITLDDNFLHEGTSFSDQPTAPNDTSANLSRVQDGIIALYNDPADTYKCTVILEEGCTLQNFGGMNGVNIEGNSELIMKSGSVITNHGTGTNGAASGVYPLSGGTLTMEEGSLITGISGSNAVFANAGTAIIGGEISNCSGGTPLRTTQSTFVISETGNVHNITGGTAALYDVGGSVVTVSGKLTDVSGVGIYPSCNSGTSKVYIEDGAEIARCGQIGVQTNLQSEIHMSGGTIHDCPIGVNVRKQSVLEMTGGSITGNGIGANLNQKGSNIARMIIRDGEVSGNTSFDYFIESTTTGYSNGSYLYLSETMLADEPSVGMQTNGKTVTIPVENVETYLGNASAPSLTSLRAEATRLGLSNERASWWFRNDQAQVSFDVSRLTSLNDEPIYALFVPVDAAGNPIGGTVYCTPVSLDSGVVNVPLSTSTYGDTYDEKAVAGYSVLLAQADVPVYTIRIDYLNKADETQVLKEAYTISVVKDSYYDVDAFVKPPINGYYFDSSDPVETKGNATSDLSIKSLYARLRELLLEAISGARTYNGEDQTISGLKEDSFVIDGETFTVSGVSAEGSGRDYRDGGYVVAVTGTPVIKNSDGLDVSYQFNITTKDGTLTIERAPVTVKADDASKEQGSPDPSLSATVSGLVNGETEDLIVYSLSRETGEDPGTYEITASGEEAQGNYLVSFETGVFEITPYANPRSLVIEAASGSFVYDGKDHTVSGLKEDSFVIDGETFTVSGVSAEGSGRDYRDGGYVVAVTGTPVIKNSDGLDVSYQFNITTKDGTLTIERAPVTVKADDASKEQGSPDPSLSATVSGLVNGETEDLIVYSLSRETGEDPGTYEITASGEEAQGNYLVSFVPAEFTIFAGKETAASSAAPRSFGVRKEVKEDNSGLYVKANDAQIGQLVEFRTTVTLNPTNAVVLLHDHMDAGLSFSGNQSIKIYTDEQLTQELDPKSYTILEKPDGDDTFTIRFSDEYLASLSGPQVLYVCYTATLNGQVLTVNEGNRSLTAQINRSWITVGTQKNQEDTTSTTTHKLVVSLSDRSESVEFGFRLAEAGSSAERLSLIKIDDENYRVVEKDESGDDSFVLVSGSVTIWGLDADKYLFETNSEGAEKIEITVKADDSTIVEA